MVRRKITREVNEIGRFNRLIKELEEICQEYSIPLDEGLEIFENVSGSKAHMRMALEKKTFTIWTAIDDLGL